MRRVGSGSPTTARSASGSATRGHLLRPAGRSSITEIQYPADAPNGIGLSPDGSTLYYAETYTGRVYRRRVAGPGQLEPALPMDPSVVMVGLPGVMLLDSLAVDGEGNVAVGTLGPTPGVTVVAPDGQWELVTAPAEYFDPLVTNICFGGPELTTAYWTCSSTGRLIAGDWPRPGLKLAF